MSESIVLTNIDSRGVAEVTLNRPKKTMLIMGR